MYTDFRIKSTSRCRSSETALFYVKIFWSRAQRSKMITFHCSKRSWKVTLTSHFFYSKVVIKHFLLFWLFQFTCTTCLGCPTWIFGPNIRAAMACNLSKLWIKPLKGGWRKHNFYLDIKEENNQMKRCKIPVEKKKQNGRNVVALCGNSCSFKWRPSLESFRVVFVNYFKKYAFSITPFKGKFVSG